MTRVIVADQAALDKALADGVDEIIIDSPRGLWLTISKYGSATVRAYGSATVRASGSATVEAYGSATVEAYDSATVEAYDSATVRAYGLATVRASGSATVRAAKYVAVHLFSQCVTLTGGVLIDMTRIDPTRIGDWCDLAGATIADGRLTVYKAVDDDLRSGQGLQYPIGSEVSDTRWRDDRLCGGGLHFSPTPILARDHFPSATRFLECAVAADEVRCIDSTKLKAPRATVVREVALFGAPVDVGAVAS